MKKVSKIMSALLALVMCLSLLPMSAFAKGYDPNDDGQDKVQTGLEKDDHKPYKPTELEDPNTPSVIVDKIVDKVDTEAIGGVQEAADNLNKVDKQEDEVAGTTEAVKNANNLLGELDALVNTTGKFEAQTDKDTLITTNEAGKEIASVEIDKIKTDDDGKVVVDQQKDADGKPEVVLGADGKPVGLQDFVANQSEAISQEATKAGTAAGKAEQAFTKAQTAARAGEQGALDDAKKDAKDAYLDANKAAVSASKVYAEAEAAVEAALAKYEELVGKDQANAKEIEAALQEAQTTLNNAQKALEDAKALKDEAAKRRDYAMLYSALAESVTADYAISDTDPEKPVEPVKAEDETDENFAKRTAEYTEKLADYNAHEAKKALADLSEDDPDYAQKRAQYESVIAIAMLHKLDRIAKTYGTMSTDEMSRTFGDVVMTGFEGYKAGYIGFDGLDNAWEAYSYWLQQNGEGTQFDKDYKAAQEAVKKMEQEKDIEPTDRDLNGYGVISGTDLLYKVYFYTLQESIESALNVSGIPVKAKEQLGQVQDGLKSYLEAEEFLTKSKAGEEATFSYLDHDYRKTITIQYAADKITIDGKEYTPDNYPKMDDVSWTAFSAAVRAQVQTKMADQLNSAYKKIFVDRVGTITKKTLYEALQDANKGLSYSEAKTLETYMDLLQYELKARAANMKYAAALEQYQTVLDSSNVTDTLLSGYKWGLEAAIREYDKLPEDEKADFLKGLEESAPQISGIVKAVLANQVPGEPIADAFISVRDLLEKDDKCNYEWATWTYQVIAEHAKAKGAEAAKAAEEAKAATDAYDKALQNVKAAQERLEKLLKEAEGKTQFAKAVEDAQQKLNAANAALGTAQAKVTATQTAQQKAQTAYEDAMRLAITVASNGNNNGNNGIFDFGGLTTIENEAVPLASGPVTRAQFLDYLWRHEGEPASNGVCTFTDVAADHEFILALAWAEQNGLVEANEDGAFEPDELVTVEAVRDILDNFADVFGTNVVAAADLTTLVGEEDEAVLNCDEVLAEFFGEEYTPAEAEDDIAA